MATENLPLELLTKHRNALGLADSFVVDGEEALFQQSSIKHASAIVFLPKSRGLIDMTLALVSGMVAEGGTVALVGANDAGIGSAKKAYEANIGPVEQKIVGSHSALYIGKNSRLGASKKIEDFLSFSSLSHGNKTLEIANLPGVFSAGALDEGTKLLLDHIPYDKQTVLDIGCGAGVIGAFYKKENPRSEVTLADKSRLAVMAAEKTLLKNALAGHAVTSDVFSDIKGTFDLILTNPPFHKGIGTDYSFIENFARTARKHLNKNGEVYVVANSFLSYQEVLEKHIGPTEIVADNKKFRVFRAKGR
jgi:16S rRNA (guanine1207-N2)-methyltransferase